METLSGAVSTSAFVGGIPSEPFHEICQQEEKTEQDLCFLSAFRSEHRIHNEFYATWPCFWRYIFFFDASSRRSTWNTPSDMVVLFIQDGVSGEED